MRPTEIVEGGDWVIDESFTTQHLFRSDSVSIGQVHDGAGPVRALTSFVRAEKGMDILLIL